MGGLLWIVKQHHCHTGLKTEVRGQIDSFFSDTKLLSITSITWGTFFKWGNIIYRWTQWIFGADIVLLIFFFTSCHLVKLRSLNFALDFYLKWQTSYSHALLSLSVCVPAFTLVGRVCSLWHDWVLRVGHTPQHLLQQAHRHSRMAGGGSHDEKGERLLATPAHNNICKTGIWIKIWVFLIGKWYRGNYLLRDPNYWSLWLT